MWDGAPCPVLVIGTDGALVETNEAARRLIPLCAGDDITSSAMPAWLADAHRRLRSSGAPAQAVSGDVAGRSFEAHPSPCDDGSVVWWLLDDTDRRLAERALRGERERAALLAEVSSALLSSLNVERCMTVTARMAAGHLADAAIIVAPAQGRRHPLTYARAGGEATQTMLQIDPRSVVGLAEALQGFPPVPARWIDPAELPDWAVPEGFDGPIGSVIVTPCPDTVYPPAC